MSEETQILKCASCAADVEVTDEDHRVVCAACGHAQFVQRTIDGDHLELEEATYLSGGEVVEDSPAAHRVLDVFRYLVRHPIEMLVYRWNWKAAVLSGVMRSMIYLVTHIKEGWRAALGAMSVEFIFRLIVSGASGSLVQSFHRAQPVWLSTLCVMFLLPAISTIIEFTLHSLNGDKRKGTAIIISITFSILSAIFNLFAMRRNALLVKDKDQQSFGRDIAKMPGIVAEFMFYPIVYLWRKSKKKVDTLNQHLSQGPEPVEKL
jgi:hypothetical protein